MYVKFMYLCIKRHTGTLSTDYFNFLGFGTAEDSTSSEYEMFFGLRLDMAYVLATYLCKMYATERNTKQGISLRNGKGS